MIKEIEKGPSFEDPELQELSELSGLSVEEITKFKELGEYGLGRNTTDFFYDLEPEELEKIKEERDAFERLSPEEQKEVLKTYGRLQSQIQGRIREMTEKITGYQDLTEEILEGADMTEEELKEREVRRKEWDNLSREEGQKRLEPIKKLDELLNPEE